MKGEREREKHRRCWWWWEYVGGEKCVVDGEGKRGKKAERGGGVGRSVYIHTHRGGNRKEGYVVHEKREGGDERHPYGERGGSPSHL